jgi:hypothetical protein
MSYNFTIRSPVCQTLPHKSLSIHYFLLKFCRRSPGLTMLVDKIAFCRSLRELRGHYIKRLNTCKDAPNCSLYTISDRLLNEYEALVE